jgi:hypothetical protein
MGEPESFSDVSLIPFLPAQAFHSWGERFRDLHPPRDNYKERIVLRDRTNSCSMIKDPVREEKERPSL